MTRELLRLQQKLYLLPYLFRCCSLTQTVHIRGHCLVFTTTWWVLCMIVKFYSDELTQQQFCSLLLRTLGLILIYCRHGLFTLVHTGQRKCKLLEDKPAEVLPGCIAEGKSAGNKTQEKKVCLSGAHAVLVKQPSIADLVHTPHAQML